MHNAMTKAQREAMYEGLGGSSSAASRLIQEALDLAKMEERSGISLTSFMATLKHVFKANTKASRRTQRLQAKHNRRSWSKSLLTRDQPSVS